MSRSDPAVQWLLDSGNPSIEYFTRIEILGQAFGSRKVRAARARIPKGQWVRGLLRNQKRDGGFGGHPYRKWTGPHWRLVSLVELGLPAGDRRARAAAEQVLRWLTSGDHRGRVRRINGLTRRCASQEGNALAVCCHLGLARDPRVRQLALSLVEWQWPDGGWNCDTRDAARKAAEFFLRHRLFRSERTGEVIHPEWLKLHYPTYWHYDILQGLVILSRAGALPDKRADDALDVLESKRLPSGAWRPGGYYWRGVDRSGSNADVIDWGRSGPNRMLTLNALRALKAARRLDVNPSDRNVRASRGGQPPAGEPRKAGHE